MTRTHLPLGVALGSIGLPAREWLELARQLAALPIDRLWVWDHLLGRGDRATPVLESLALVSAALTANPELRVGTLVLDVTKRHPAVAAKAAATIAALAPGRFTLGLGAGGDAAEHEALEIPFGATEARIVALGDAIRVARELMEGDVAPRPAPRVEIVIAGDHPASIDLAARAADGWVAPVASFKDGRRALRAAAQRAGRPAAMPRAYVVQELSRSSTIAATPFGQNPVGWLAEWAGHGADVAIVTLRSAADVAELAELLAALR